MKSPWLMLYVYFSTLCIASIVVGKYFLPAGVVMLACTTFLTFIFLQLIIASERKKK